jgi:hypothetical protein
LRRSLELPLFPWQLLHGKGLIGWRCERWPITKFTSFSRNDPGSRSILPRPGRPASPQNRPPRFPWKQLQSWRNLCTRLGRLAPSPEFSIPDRRRLGILLLSPMPGKPTPGNSCASPGTPPNPTRAARCSVRSPTPTPCLSTPPLRYAEIRRRTQGTAVATRTCGAAKVRRMDHSAALRFCSRQTRDTVTSFCNSRPWRKGSTASCASCFR